MSPLQHLISILLVWVACQLFPRRHGVHLLAGAGLLATLIYAPVAAAVIALTVAEAVAIVLWFSNLPRKSDLRQYGPYLLILNLLFVDFHYSALNMPVATLGISFSTIRIFMTAKQILSSRKALPLRDLYWIFVSGFYLPALVIGPVFSGLDLKAQFQQGAPENVTLRDYRMILMGLVLAILASVLFGNVAAIGSEHFGDIAMAPLYFLQLFTAFWGQSLIAEHTSRFFGYRLPINFRYPWKARTPQDFWNRWHRSMAQFVLQYIFLPLNLRGLPPKLATITAFIFMGLWHNLTLGYLVWGIFHGILLAYSPKAGNLGRYGVVIRIGLWLAVIGLSNFANHGPFS